MVFLPLRVPFVSFVDPFFFPLHFLLRTPNDMNFVILKERDFEDGKAQIDHLKGMARANGRDVQSWIHVYAVCRETEREAQDYCGPPASVRET